MYGIDISKERIDEQDRKIIIHAAQSDWKIKRCLILGSGEGRIPIILALMGFEVVCIDIDDYSDYYTNVNKLFNFKKPIEFVQQDISTMQTNQWKEHYSLVLVQRVLHYLPYFAIKDILMTIKNMMTKQAYLYVACSCIDSDMGVEYQGTHTLIEERFSKLSPEMQQRFQLDAPVCLFSLAEFKELMQETNFKEQELYQTAFRNIKGTFQV